MMYQPGWVGVRIYWGICILLGSDHAPRELAIQAVDEDGFPIGYFDNGKAFTVSLTGMREQCNIPPDSEMHRFPVKDRRPLKCPMVPSSWKSKFYVRFIDIN
jgi:hypothetical protein